MKYTSYVNVFQGNGTVSPMPLYAPADSWRFIKGLTGNTSPAACLPFGKYSCGAYSGGYSSGYGVNCINYGEQVKALYDSPKLIGFTHFHQSGTGAIGKYYNYALTAPFFGVKPDFALHDIISEFAEPGYYSVEIAGIKCEAGGNVKACRSAGQKGACGGA